MLQWGRGLGTAESIDFVSEARPLGMLAWGRGLGTSERLDAARQQQAGAGASMGPRSWDRGEWGMLARMKIAAEKLQWGRGLGTAESSPNYARQFPDDPLQWGRGLGTAESFRAAFLREEFGLASMGPRSWDRGEPAPKQRKRNKRWKLQWGRGLGTAERRRNAGK